MSIGWPDLGGALLLTLAGLLIVGGILGIVAWDARRRRSGSVLLDVTAAVARMWLAVVGLGAVFSAVRWFSNSPVWIADLPIAAAWPTALPCSDPGPFENATLVCASITGADASIASLSIGPVLLLMAADLMNLVVAAVPALIVAVLCSQARGALRFRRSASTWLFAGAIAMLVAGLAAAILTGSGQAMAAVEVLPPPGDGAVTTTGVYRLDIPLWPIGAALGLAALGALFRHAAVLQRDTEGLV